MLPLNESANDIWSTLDGIDAYESTIIQEGT
jgi:hypothetical protein